jgi:DNA-3-methyladenine glycosylase II
MKTKRIKSHFKKVDPVIYKVIVNMELEVLPQPKRSTSYLKKLCREIISQQLGGKAARAIINRFYDLFERKHITPDKILVFSEQKLRNVGMSWAKARYTRDLAQKVKDKEVRLNNLHNLDDELVIEELVKVKGIGNWTAEMFLIFTLGREDVFSHGDLGLIKAIQRLYGFKDKPNEKQINKIVDKWSPYKSYGCFALWKSIDNPA